MKFYARVDDGTVVLETTNISDDMEFLPADLGLPGKWVVCSESTYPGMTYTAKGNKFAPPPPIPFTQADRDRAYQTVLNYANALTSQITGKYPDAEVATWPLQQSEASDVLAGKALPAPSIIASLSAAAGIPAADFAKTVIAKARAYNAIITAVQMTRTKAQTALATCNSHDDVTAALIALRTEADAQAKAMGLVVPS